MMNSIHQLFIRDVIKGRGGRLKINANTFSGLAWTGAQAQPQGLIDGYGSAGDIARTLFKTNDIQDFTVKPGPIDLFAQKFGSSFALHLGALLNSWRLS